MSVPLNEPPPWANEDGPACPRCSADIEPDWRYCPFCETPLGRRGRHDAKPAPVAPPPNDLGLGWIVYLVLLAAGTVVAMLM